jgi:tellurite methyltransferase
LSNAVLHFAATDEEFHAWLDEMWRVLKPGGIFFARLASDVGIEDRVQCISGRRYHLPDGSDRYLVSERILLELAQKLGADQLEPIKTTNVQNLRCMTTWVLRKK